MKKANEEIEIKSIEIAISESKLNEKNLPSDIFDQIVEILKTIYVPLRERLALGIVEKLESGVPMENLIEEAKKIKIEILKDKNVQMLYMYHPPERDRFDLIIGRAGLERQFNDKHIPSDIIKETVQILKTMYKPLQERLAMRIAKKLKNGLPIENLVEETIKLKKDLLMSEKEKRHYMNSNKNGLFKERTDMIKWLWANASGETIDEITRLIAFFTNEEQGVKGQIVAEEFARKINDKITENLTEQELVAEAKKTQEELIKKL